MENNPKIYTRKGDLGSTTLIGGKVVSKTCIRVESYGMVDELNSFTGYLYEQVENPNIRSFLFQIMNKLFLIESHLAVAQEDVGGKMFPDVLSSDTEAIEKEIDRLSDSLPVLTYFILPAGGVLAGLAHTCRTICRRTERTVLRLHESEPVHFEILKYINRLSDYYFVLARELSRSNGSGDIAWISE